MSTLDEAYAAQAPDWASPPFFIHIDSVSTRRRATQEYIGEAWALDGQTKMEGWKRAYRRGWRIVRVRVCRALNHGE